MRKQMKLKNIIIFIVTVMVVLMSRTVYAENYSDLYGTREYSQEYLDWLKLDEETRKNSIMPRMYNVYEYDKDITSPIKLARVGAGVLSGKFSLNDYINENMKINSQGSTQLCWTFASIESLETNLALKDYYKNATTKVYDFSERHMEYATSRKFLNGVINENGFNRNVGDGAIFEISEAYLTNGTGAIDEKEMPFVDTTDLININEIQNKTITGQVADTTEFPTTSTMNKNDLIVKMKESIRDCGGISAELYEENGSTNSYLNKVTGALYCNDNSIPNNHAVLIVGWDDDYSVDNFVDGNKPQNKGAWLARDSHGTYDQVKSLKDTKDIIFDTYKGIFQAMGINSVDQLSDEDTINFVEDMGWKYKDGNVYVVHNDNGYLHISYDDVKVYQRLMGITNAVNYKNYENIYQHNFYGSNYAISLAQNKCYLANIFDKKTSGKEYINQVSINTPETVTCKVYLNQNGKSISKNDLQLVQLQAGESETFDAGYHTLEFLNPIEIKGNQFAVVVEIQGKESNKLRVSTEINYPEEYKLFMGSDLVPDEPRWAYSVVKVESGKCFISSEQNFDSGSGVWADLANIYDDSNKNYPNCNSTIKAFTVTSLDYNKLSSIQIATPPTKTTYIAGENFNNTGMIVKANYNRNANASEIINSSSYNITNGANLKAGQSTITVTYDGKSTEQKINVIENSVEKIAIKTPPTTTEYKEGHNFDKTGMVVEATYKDGTTKTITDYTVTDGSNLKANQTEVTISYGGKEVRQKIKILSNPLEKIQITKVPNKLSYVAGQSFDKTGMAVTATYKDGTKQEISDYTIENGTNLTEGQTSVTIKYEGQVATQSITTVKKSVINISISKQPSKVKYIKDKDKLDLSGGMLKISYNDNLSEEISLTSSEVSVSNFDNTKLGKNTINITYQSKTIPLDVEVVEEEKAHNSNLDNINCLISNMKYYTFTNTNTREYVVMDASIGGIVKNNDNDSLEYYYYLSANKEENNIANWIKISPKGSSDKLEFTINTNDSSNYNELINADNIYIYIKEVATKGENQSIAISKSLKLDESGIDVEIYSDGVKKGGITNNSTDVDTTVATSKIPQTGTGIVTIIVIISIVIIGIYVYIRYKKLSKYTKF